MPTNAMKYKAKRRVDGTHWRSDANDDQESSGKMALRRDHLSEGSDVDRSHWQTTWEEECSNHRQRVIPKP